MRACTGTCKRGQVTFFNQSYAAPELMRRDVNGREVSVRYDIHDPSFVRVYTLDGQYVCEAKFTASRRDFYATPVIDMAKDKRVQAAIKRRQQQIDTALRELQAPVDADSGNTVFLSGPAAPEALPFVEVISPSSPPALASTGEAAQAASDRPVFDTFSDRYEWLMAHREAWTDEDAAWLRQYVASDDYEGLAEYYAARGLSWDDAGLNGEDMPGFKSAL